jgi:hypothetical protein
MKSMPKWQKKRSRRLQAKLYQQLEGGPWLPFPYQYGSIKIPTFLSHIEHIRTGCVEFHYGGQPLHLHSVRFVDPFQGVDSPSSGRNVFDASVWERTKFATGWRDELEAWEKT